MGNSQLARRNSEKSVETDMDSKPSLVSGEGEEEKPRRSSLLSKEGSMRLKKDKQKKMIEAEGEEPRTPRRESHLQGEASTSGGKDSPKESERARRDRNGSFVNRFRKSSKQKERDQKEASMELSPPVLKEPPEQLTEEQRFLLVKTWRILEDDINKVGVITFISLFETHPDVQHVFMPFSGLQLDELKHSKQLRAHALRVMGFVQKSIARINEPEKLDQIIRDLGKKHYAYGAKPEYVDLIYPQFLQAIRPSLKDDWSDEVESCWCQLFAHISYFMQEAMREAAEEEAWMEQEQTSRRASSRRRWSLGRQK